MNEQLTIEQVEVLEHLHINIMSDAIAMQVPVLRARFPALLDSGYIDSGTNGDGLYWQITDTGKQALAAYKAQRDLVLFIAEFEEWLEAEAHKVGRECKSHADEWNRSEHRTMERVVKKYRACKERITDNVK